MSNKTDAFEIVCSTHDRDAWLEARKTGIGASDAAAVIGECSWRTPLQLYAEKAGLIESDDLSDLEWVEWGHRLEGPILEAYIDRTGRGCRSYQKLVRSIAYPWALCTCDGFVVHEDGKSYPLEIKTASAFRASDWVDGPPRQYVIQVHWQMLVTGAPRATIACLIGGQKLVWADIERDEVLINKLIYHGAQFWKRVLDKNAPPACGDDAETLRKLHPTDNGETIALSDEFDELADEIAACKAEAKAIKKRQDAAEAKLKEAIADNLCAMLPSGRIARWSTHERKGYVVQPSTCRQLSIKDR